jgi:threonine synthase
MIAQVLNESDVLLDPHSAVGVAAGRAKRGNTKTPIISLATAHPAKFPDAVKDASGQHPELPEHMRYLFERDEKTDVLENDLDQVRAHIVATLEGNA